MRVRSPSDLAEAAPELAEAIALIPEYDPWVLQPEDGYFDVQAARGAIAWIPTYCRHVKGPLAGKPFVLAPFQAGIVAAIWGFRNADGTRRFRVVFLYVGKKNAKSSLSAALILLVMATDREQGAEVYSVASTQKQAGLVFDHAAGMVRQEPRLKQRLKVLGDKGGSVAKAIVDYRSMSSYKCLASDADSADGVNPHMNVIDEVHRHRTGELMDVLVRSTSTRRQPLTIYTTTADYNRPSACNDLRKYALSVRANDGDAARPGYDPEFLPCIWEAEAEDDHGARETWLKANPGLGVIKSEEAMAKAWREAREIPSKLNPFLRLDLNIVTDADEAWLDMVAWDRCVGERAIQPGGLEEWILAHGLLGQPCYAALDLSRTVDLTALVLWFPERRVVLPFAWIPEDTGRKAEERDRVPYSVWARHGHLEVTPGNVVDYEHVRTRILQEVSRFDVRWFGYDPWNATQMAQQLQDAGVPVEEYRQGYVSMSEPSKDLERRVLSGEVVHGGHPVLRWCASNAMVKRDPAGNIKPDKSKSTGRIDLLVALVMAIGGAIASPAPRRQSMNEVYAEEAGSGEEPLCY